MKIQIVSDLHTEFGQNPKFTPGNIVGDVLLIAGDTGTNPLKVKDYLLQFNKVPVIVVLGNHEFYGHEYTSAKLKYKEVLDSPQENLYLLDNEELILPQFPGYSFFGCTLWTDLATGDPEKIAQYMNDYHQIKILGDTKFRPSHTRKEHVKSRQYLDQRMSLCKNKKIVLTHHLPSYQSTPHKYIGNFLNAAYASNLEELIFKHQPLLWAHGHTHSSQDYYLGNTKVVCNPYGYFRQEENLGFNPEFVVEV